VADVLDKDGLPGGVKSFLRTLGVAVITTALILAGLTLAYGGANNARDKLATDTLNVNLATACVLSLPVEPEGRDPQLVQLCFTQYGIEPPILHNP